MSYAYELHGWLKSITTNSFKEDLFYADCPDKAYNCYNGNIGTMRWSNSNYEQIRGYKFVYDNANRLTDALYGERAKLDNKVNRYNEVLEYDENGNITNLQRRGLKQDGEYGKIDNLNLSYIGNQLSSVEEDAKDYDYEGSFEYKKANGSQYLYDENGSLIADKSRKIAYITYDQSNNPQQIYFTNGNVTKYIYSASGQKLRAIHYTAKPNITRTWRKIPDELTLAQILLVDSTDYLLGGSLVMKNGKIDKVLFDGGYAQATAVNKTTKDKFAFYYYNQDHLGNNREVVNAKGVVQQVTNYYPFGAPYADATAVKGVNLQPYKYNGKELDLMHGLNTYDYGARQHDPILCRWDRIDPLCEKYYSTSPYAYCANNPVRFIDPDGEFICIADENNNLYYYNMNKGDFFNSEGEKYSGKLFQDFFKNVASNLSKLSSTKTGKELVSFLTEHESGVRIAAGKFSENEAGENKDNVLSVVGFSGDTKSDSPLFISLGHELAHSQDRFNGTIDMSDWITNPEDGGHPIPKAEIYATFVENKLRKENNIPLRRSYTKDRDTKSWDYNTSIIDFKNRSLYFDKNGAHLPQYKKIAKENRYTF